MKSSKVYGFGEFHLFPHERRLTKRTGESVALTPRVFDLLVFLVESGGETVSRSELLDKIWGEETFVEEANLTQSISVLRKALGETKDNHPFILTVPQHGYRFIAEVREISSSENKARQPDEISADLPAGDAKEPTRYAETNGRPPQNGESYLRDKRLRYFTLSALAFVSTVLLSAFWLWRAEPASPGEIKSLNEAESRRFAKNYTDNVDAYALYSHGRSFWSKRTKKDFWKAIEFYRRTLVVDPNYAPAYAGIAECYLMLGDYAYLSPADSFPQAGKHARTALSLDPQLAEAHAALAYVKFVYDWDWSGAEDSFKKAIELNPNYPTAHQWYAEFLASRERFDQAERELDAARRLEPNNIALNAVSGWILYLKRDYDAAINKHRQTIELDPNFFLTHMFLALALDAVGERAEALAEYELAVKLDPNAEAAAYLGRAYALAGRRAEALRTIENLKARSVENYISPFFFALVYDGLDEREQMFDWLEKAVDERARVVTLWTVEPHLDNLRDEPRFKSLVRRANL
jgi:DNA-binding winged helix-turn-helix (wHTH) protein/Flp pilus assembly protein TadD